MWKVWKQRELNTNQLLAEYRNVETHVETRWKDVDNSGKPELSTGYPHEFQQVIHIFLAQIVHRARARARLPWSRPEIEAGNQVRGAYDHRPDSRKKASNSSRLAARRGRRAGLRRGRRQCDGVRLTRGLEVSGTTHAIRRALRQASRPYWKRPGWSNRPGRPPRGSGSAKRASCPPKCWRDWCARERAPRATVGGSIRRPGTPDSASCRRDARFSLVAPRA